MANLEKLAANYRSEGYSALLAEARVTLTEEGSENEQDPVFS